jgi:hypothetical protein
MIRMFPSVTVKPVQTKTPRKKLATSAFVGVFGSILLIGCGSKVVTVPQPAPPPAEVCYQIVQNVEISWKVNLGVMTCP